MIQEAVHNNKPPLSTETRPTHPNKYKTLQNGDDVLKKERNKVHRKENEHKAAFVHIEIIMREGQVEILTYASQ
ncbi:hypothetical protein E2C01_025674 [Portunus trituberculatus]|uniref:Uncharacterized protein n=1 Tax=Portunus trituberculatus TaxID=210409 RepID=A0A5B7EIK1_PORTR|nr:hypothetical protein [Portunus trituberculatus]